MLRALWPKIRPMTFIATTAMARSWTLTGHRPRRSRLDIRDLLAAGVAEQHAANAPADRHEVPK
jgi:hypothetical protein